MTKHGMRRTQTIRYANNQITVSNKFWCAKCEFYVDESQWNKTHKSHTDLTSREGAFVALPDTAKPMFMTKSAGGRN